MNQFLSCYFQIRFRVDETALPSKETIFIIEKSVLLPGEFKRALSKFVTIVCSDRDRGTCELSRARNGEEGCKQDPCLPAFHGRDAGREKTCV